MPTKVLSEDLDNCLIDYDKGIKVTNLLNDYGGTLEEVSDTLKKSIAAEENKGKKFIKTFLFRGVIDNYGNQIITLVSEDKLADLENKFKDSHSILYSVETDGSTQCLPTATFTPVKHQRLVLSNVLKISENVQGSNATINGANPVESQKTSETSSKASTSVHKKNENETHVRKTENNVKSVPKTSPGESKKSGKNEMKNFFGKVQEKKPTSTENHISEEKISKKPVDSSKKVNDFFRKQDKPTPIPAKKTPEKPIQVEVEPDQTPSLLEDESSSDEEETLKALKREILSEDDEIPETPKVKRRRIADSDDEESTLNVKTEEKDDVIEVDDEPVQVKTFQDDDGFMITVKDKAVKRKSPRKISPRGLSKSAAKSSDGGKKETKSAATNKTKQGSIMSFFGKK